jgi:hypothetical protein
LLFIFGHGRRERTNEEYREESKKEGNIQRKMIRIKKERADE